MELSKSIVGKIFDIQGFSVHDGPGARTLIFLKGCTLNCFWCSNPEGISTSNSLLYYASKCIKCGRCTLACPHNAIHLKEDILSIDREICRKCKDFSCLDNCYTDALRLCGKDVNVEELFSLIQRDRQFWGADGGVTFTGGEPLLQADFIGVILEKCYNAYIHTAVETCGNVPWKNFEKTIDCIDWLFFDIKHNDLEHHKSATGQSNELITNNILKLNERFKGRMVFRLPLIPGFNNSIETLEEIARLISTTQWKEINILPLHHLGSDKYKISGTTYKGLQYAVPKSSELKQALAIFEKYNIQCHLGHETSF